MRFSLPTTYAMWNQRNIHRFDEAAAREPPARQHMTICEHMGAAARLGPDPDSSQAPLLDPSLMFPDDVTTGLCALGARIWELSSRSSLDASTHAPTPPTALATARSSLLAQLNYWKSALDQFSLYHDPESQPYPPPFHHPAQPIPERSLPDSFWHGLESRSRFDWPSVVRARAAAQHFDAVNLYHLLSLHVLADVRGLARLARRGDADTDGAEGDVAAQKAREWAACESARRAVLHAAGVLRSYQADASRGGDARAGREPGGLMALSVSALVVQSYITFSASAAANPPCPVQQGGKHALAAEVDEQWAERGGWPGGEVPRLDGLPLCGCVMGEVVRGFGGWMAGDGDGWAGRVGGVGGGAAWAG
jgi:hypothetical protein